VQYKSCTAPDSVGPWLGNMKAEMGVNLEEAGEAVKSTLELSGGQVVAGAAFGQHEGSAHEGVGHRMSSHVQCFLRKEQSHQAWLPLN
jgi:hypothetical protein